MVMLTLYRRVYRTVKRSTAETVLEKASVHTRNSTFEKNFSTEQDHFTPFLKDEIPATQQSICSCSHYTGSVSATLRFIIQYNVSIACDLTADNKDLKSDTLLNAVLRNLVYRFVRMSFFNAWISPNTL